jgi:hypothetical protein
MATQIDRGIATAAQLAVIAEARGTIAAGLGVRAELTRTDERQPISRWIKSLVHTRDRWTCQWCGNYPWSKSEDRRAELIHVDHVIPWSAGGSDRTDNLRTLCDGCNRYRSNYVSDMRNTTPTPIVRICDPCLGVFEPRGEKFAAWCACRHHNSYSTIGAAIL